MHLIRIGNDVMIQGHEDCEDCGRLLGVFGGENGLGDGGELDGESAPCVGLGEDLYYSTFLRRRSKHMAANQSHYPF
ncbi:hypothetical protein HPP92_027501 [Vanilla planifolia]|uniref:Uncharacterized protein n=1 Tax=Vanilla planifolia TaxID=51239 RepID=A0A835PB20_VANPL|nr:hypothetical protein HPP92_027501 [Vanilla planifolia]KAG0449130.1 hypothetical protein HPP92_027517 [Vanilla planifolia]